MIGLGLMTWFRFGRARVDVRAGAVAFAGAGYFAVMVASPREAEWHLDSAASRIAWHAVPASIVVLADQMLRSRALDAGRSAVA